MQGELLHFKVFAFYLFTMRLNQFYEIVLSTTNQLNLGISKQAISKRKGECVE